MIEQISFPKFKVCCDMCGRDCKDEIGNNEYMSLRASWGYSTKHDTEKWSADFCEECSDKIYSLIIDAKGRIRVESIYKQ